MKNKILGTILFGIIVFIIYNISKAYFEKNDVIKNGKESIGKYVSHDSWAKGETNTFEYYINLKKIQGNGGRAPKNFSKNIGKFYKIVYSEKYVGSVQAFYDEEIIDTTAILAAGFSEKDL